MESVIRIENPSDGVFRVVMTRADKGNAQTNGLLYALDDAFKSLCANDECRVIILAGEGKHFSTGHDLVDFDATLKDVEPVSLWGSFGGPAMEGYMAFEEEAFFGLPLRWRNMPKPLVGEIQGKVIAAGLALAWVCDIVIASEDAVFVDPVVTAGFNGIEYFAHPWELGVRKAKEMLFTGQGLTAAAAERAGMVNRVVPLERLSAEVLELAQRIAEQPVMGVRLAKMAVNQTQDEQGYSTALRAAMNLQHLSHAQQFARYGMPADAGAGPAIRKTLKLPPL
jgi:enoyl-CoA hydratase